jgi:hypothetical protein
MERTSFAQPGFGFPVDESLNSSEAERMMRRGEAANAWRGSAEGQESKVGSRKPVPCACAFYARFRHVSMCRTIETVWRLPK